MVGSARGFGNQKEASDADHAKSPRFSHQPYPRRAPPGVLGARAPLADEGPLETTAIRLVRTSGICVAPIYIAEELLRAEGFADISYVSVPGGVAARK